MNSDYNNADLVTPAEHIAPLKMLMPDMASFKARDKC